MINVGLGSMDMMPTGPSMCPIHQQDTLSNIIEGLLWWQRERASKDVCFLLPAARGPDAKVMSVSIT